jgi:hypothetical protein
VHFPLGPPADRACAAAGALDAGIVAVTLDRLVAVRVVARSVVYGLRVEAEGYAAAIHDLVLEPGGAVVVSLMPDASVPGWSGGTVGATNLEGVAAIGGDAA